MKSKRLPIILGSGLAAFVLAAALNLVQPEQFQAVCELRRSQGGGEVLRSLDLGGTAGDLRILLLGPSVRGAVAKSGGFTEALGRAGLQGEDSELNRFYDEHISVIPASDPDLLFVIGRDQRADIAARLANEVGKAGLAVLSNQMAERRAARMKEDEHELAALQTRAHEIEEAWTKATRGEARRSSETLRLETELRVVLERIEDRRLVEAPGHPTREPWFVQTEAVTGRHVPGRGWLPVVAASLFATALAALVILASDERR